jgi:L,D-peptidoglycan transpeptidase YkuD (ErfK/YbiS/YcfS/YnhG family)
MHRQLARRFAIVALVCVTSCATAAPRPQVVQTDPTSTTTAAITTVVIATEGQDTTVINTASATSATVVSSLDSAAIAGCHPDVLRAVVQRNGSARQWIIVLAPTTTSTSATLEIATLGADDQWHCSLAGTAARLGRKGIRPLLDRRSGDDTTPSGIFPLGTVLTPQGPVSFFGNSPDPGALGAYRHVQNDDCYGANPNTPGYGHWRSDASGCTGADELLHSIGAAYEHAVLIGANTEPAVSGDAPGEIAYASAIFLHRFTYTAAGSPKPTSGCVSVSHSALLTALRSIDPNLDPHFAIGTVQSLTAG